MIATENICAPSVALSESLDKYLALRGIDRKKYYAKYLIAAGKVWEEIFQKTLWVVQSQWKELKAGDPYNYIDKPRDCLRWFSVASTDECGNIVPLYYNSQLNILPKPTSSNCSCAGCGCDGMCQDLNGMTLTTKEAFTINGITYYEKTWLQYCTNGDILEWREVPTKKFNDYVGDGGDFNNDYNNDYDIGSNPFANFDIVTQTFQKKLCSLTTRPCGCPQDTPENRENLNCFCSCYLPIFGLHKRKHCHEFVENTNNNHYGEIKESECGTKIYFKPSKKWKLAGKSKYPSHLLVNFQTSGVGVSQETQVPLYAEVCLWAGTDYYTKLFNNTYSQSDKKLAEYKYNDEVNKIILYLNPIDLHFVNQVQDEKISW